MSRQQTPDIMGEVLAGQTTPTLPAIALRWDYSQAGAHAGQVQEYAARIKRSEARATSEIITAGESLLAVKELLQHGQWADWLDVEFAMTDRTARNLMAIAERFGGKTEIISDLRGTVLGLIAGDSVPEPARQAVIDASAHGERVTVKQAKAIIAAHKPSVIKNDTVSLLPPEPAPRTVSPQAPAQRPLTRSEMAMINQGIEQDRQDRREQRAIGGKDRQYFAPVAAPTYQVNGPPLPAWVTTDIAGWQIVIDERTDPAELAAELQRVGVGSDWIEALFDAYMGEVQP